MTRPRIDVGAWLRGALVCATVVFLVSPLVVVVLFAFNSTPNVTLPLNGLSLKWFDELSTDTTALDAMRTSFLLALVTGVLSTVLATLAAYALHRRATRVGLLVEALAVVPLIIPSLVYGVALLLMLDALSVAPSSVTVVAGHVTVALPFSYLIVRAGMATIPVSMLDAATDLGAGTWRTLMRVVVPLAWPAIVASFISGFVVSLNEFVVAFFNGGLTNTVPIFIYSQYKRLLTPEVNALSTVMVLVSAVAVLGLLALLAGARAAAARRLETTS